MFLDAWRFCLVLFYVLAVWFYVLCFMQHVMRASEFLNQGLNTSPLQWKLRVLTTGLPGKFPDACFKESCGALAFSFISRLPSTFMHEELSHVRSESPAVD